MDKWKEVIEYIDLLKQYTKADPQKVLNVLKNNWKAVGAPAAKDDDYTLVRKAWTLYVCLGIYNGFGTPFKERKEATLKTTSIASSKETSWTVIKVSTQPSQAEGFLL